MSRSMRRSFVVGLLFGNNGKSALFVTVGLQSMQNGVIDECRRPDTLAGRDEHVLRCETGRRKEWTVLSNAKHAKRVTVWNRMTRSLERDRSGKKLEEMCVCWHGLFTLDRRRQALGIVIVTHLAGLTARLCTLQGGYPIHPSTPGSGSKLCAPSTWSLLTVPGRLRDRKSVV